MSCQVDKLSDVGEEEIHSIHGMQGKKDENIQVANFMQRKRAMYDTENRK